MKRELFRFLVVFGVVIMEMTGCGGSDDTSGESEKVVMKPSPTQVVSPQTVSPPVGEAEVPVIIGNPRQEPEPPPERDIEEPEPEPLNLGGLDYKALGDGMKVAQRVAAERLKLYSPEEREGESELYAAYVEIFHLDDFIPSALLRFVHNTLLKIYLEQKPEHERVAYRDEPLLLEYLRLQSQFPLKTEAQLLELFRESIKVGNISIDVDNLKPPREVWAEEWKPEPEVRFEFELAPGVFAEESPFLEEARAEFKSRQQRYAEASRDWGGLSAEERLKKETEIWGFDPVFTELNLFRIHREEKPEAAKTNTLPLFIEYIRLSLGFPNEPEEELLRLLRERVREGKVVAHGPNPKPTLEPDPLANREIYLEVVCKITNREWDRINDEIGKRITQNPGLNPEFVTDDVYKEVFGVGLFFMIYVLKPIVEEEMPDLVSDRGFDSGPFLYEYLALKLAYPELDDHELIELFRLSARRGNISELPGEERPTCPW